MKVDIVKSTMLKSLEYNQETQELIVEFTNGSRYKYFNVPRTMFDALLSAEGSIGAYFTANVKNKFNYERL